MSKRNYMYLQESIFGLNKDPIIDIQVSETLKASPVWNSDYVATNEDLESMMCSTDRNNEISCD